METGSGRGDAREFLTVFGVAAAGLALAAAAAFAPWYGEEPGEARVVEVRAPADAAAPAQER